MFGKVGIAQQFGIVVFGLKPGSVSK